MVDRSPAVERRSVVPPIRQCTKRVQRDAFVKNVKRYVLKRVAIQRDLRDRRHVDDNVNLCFLFSDFDILPRVS